MSITDSNHPCGAHSHVFCPFQTRITAGHCTFQVNIPKPFLTGYLPSTTTTTTHSLEPKKRQFHFAALSLYPSFYNRDALLLNYDTTEDLALKLKYDVEVRYNVSTSAYANQGELNVPRGETVGLAGWLTNLNQLSVGLKPDGMTRPPFFFDWIDLINYEAMSDMLKESGNADEVIASEALDYYNEAFDPTLHANKLPSSCKTVPGSNPYLLPTNNVFVAVEDRLRLRLCVAPQTKVAFSSQKVLEHLGFIGLSRATNRRFVFSNPLSNGYVFFTADVMPDYKVRVEATKLSVSPTAESFFHSTQLLLTGPDMRSHEALLKELKALFVSLTQLTNVDMDVTYDNTSKLFAFQWPNNAGIHVTLTGNEELFETLGFGLVKSINKTSTGKEFSVNTRETSGKTKVLVFDTGQVIVTCSNAASNTTSITSNQYMVSLFPLSSGKMEMLTDGKAASSVVPPAFETVNNNMVVLECKLWKFNDAGVMVPFNWVCGSVMTGILMGRL